MKYLLLLICIAFLASCTNESYETGDGELSYLRAEYADIVIKDKRIVSITTDDDRLLPLAEADRAVSNTGDTILRRMIYYTQKEDNAPIDIVSTREVGIITPLPLAINKITATDPVVFRTAWLSANRKYLNMQIAVKTGTPEGQEKLQHVISTTIDSINTSGRGHCYITLRHQQNGIPEYYTQDVYLSIPVTRLSLSGTIPDTVSLCINTYQGRRTTPYIIYTHARE